MSDNAIKRASPLKRKRRTKAQIDELREVIREVLEADHPQSVRHVFYCVYSDTGLIEKTESGYNTVQAQLLKMRLSGEVPWTWVSDGTRWRIEPQTYSSVANAIEITAHAYRRDLWARTPAYCEIWCESDSIAATIVQETDPYNVPLLSSRGFSSRSFLYRSAQHIKAQNRPAFLYYVGDWDPSGKIIPENINKVLREHAPDADIAFERLLVTPEQIENWRLPTKPPKKSTHSNGWKGGTVEAEAIPAKRTRKLVREAIEKHLDMREVSVIRVAEESERSALFSLARMHSAGAVQ
ncbi:MAG: hypothetical protein HOM52_12830 [Rhodospirillaceae bacterium]|jgi:hypothetical protein|nr:hypothetical protein [Rhodospirillaceae bacterium]MBT5039389.1 hypothetical protein [Rhodospirillaceae bacterium]MBT7291195.1 hypothetical protein [Rhodospirillaceae bacterium]